jgi:hypothetical protein
MKAERWDFSPTKRSLLISQTAQEHNVKGFHHFNR